MGAGPGDPGLLTLRGRQLLEQADVLLYDYLVDERLLLYARRGAEIVSIAEWHKGGRPTQREVDGFLIDHALKGNAVVHLKAGDPFVIDRGAEEVQALASAGVAFEVVPGVTSAIAVPAYAGIPVTHSKLASSFTVLSGGEDTSLEELLIDWSALAASAGTLVVLMGWESLPGIIERLVSEGMAMDTPASLIQWGTHPKQRTVVGSLGDILPLGREAGLQPPVVALFGKVVGLRDQLRWYDNRPLSGKRIMVTRPRFQAGALSDLLAQEGADPIEVPCIEVVPLEEDRPLREAAKRLSEYRWVVFISVNGVEAFWKALEGQGLDARAFGGVQVAAIGPATAESLAYRGILADLVPGEYVAEALLEELGGYIRTGDTVLLPRAEGAREVLAEGLRAKGASVEEIVAYRTRVPRESAERARRLLRDDGVDVVTFTSSSTARNLAELVGKGSAQLLSQPTIACIGPVTAATARELGLRVDIEAREHTMPGLVEAIRAHCANEQRMERGSAEGESPSAGGS